METIRWNVTDPDHNKAVKEAASYIRNGHVVAFPTETVYGLGADATNETAVSKIFKAKGRPQDNPLIVHVATKEQLENLVTSIPAKVSILIDHFSPGALTYILPSHGKCALNVTAGLSTVAVRIPDHPVALRLLKEADVPIAAPSANLSGKPSPTRAEHVWHDLNGKIAGILDGGPTGIGLESTVIDCTDDIPVILRPGGVTTEQLESVIGSVKLDPALINKVEKPKSPGMKYKHYAPEIPLWIVEGDAAKIQPLIENEQKKGKRVGVLAHSELKEQLHADHIIDLGNSPKKIANNLYTALRSYHKGNADLIICEALPEYGIGQAIMNRLKKAASKFIR